MDHTQTKTRHEAALIGARARWGPPRIVRLDGLTPEQRRLVLAMVEMAKATDTKEAGPVDNGPALAEVQRGSAERSAA